MSCRKSQFQLADFGLWIWQISTENCAVYGGQNNFFLAFQTISHPLRVYENMCLIFEANFENMLLLSFVF